MAERETQAAGSEGTPLPGGKQVRPPMAGQARTYNEAQTKRDAMAAQHTSTAGDKAEFTGRWMIQGNRKSRTIVLRDDVQLPAFQFVFITDKRNWKKALRFNHKDFYTVLSMPEGWTPDGLQWKKA